MSIAVRESCSIREHLQAFVGECIAGGILYKDALQQLELHYIMAVLSQTGNNVSRAAKALGINRNTLSKKIEEFQKFESFRTHQRLFSSR